MSLLIDCPANCGVDVPEFDFSKCNPETLAAQVTDIFFTSQGEPFIKIDNPAEWLARVDNDSAAIDAIRHLTVIGSKPKPDQTKKLISHNRNVVGQKTHKLPFKIDELTQGNLDAQRELECGGTYLMWFVIGGTKVFGGNEGITASITADVTATDNIEDLALIEGEWEWKSKFTPESTDWIITADDLTD